MPEATSSTTTVELTLADSLGLSRNLHAPKLNHPSARTQFALIWRLPRCTNLILEPSTCDWYLGIVNRFSGIENARERPRGHRRTLVRVLKCVAPGRIPYCPLSPRDLDAYCAQAGNRAQRSCLQPWPVGQWKSASRCTPAEGDYRMAQGV